MKKKFYTALFLTSTLLFSSCITVNVVTPNDGKTIPTKHEVKSSTSSKKKDFDRREYSLQALMWQQNAGEYIALCYQAFETARFRLDEQLKDMPEAKLATMGKKLAIITDIDETVMDNSPFQAKIYHKNEDYTLQEWQNWTMRGKADEVPGAAEFLNYAKSRGVEVFYVSNRTTDELQATLENMKVLNFPFADEQHVFLMSSTTSKKERFDRVRKDYEVLLYMGDNLTDFTSKFRVSSTDDRNKLVKDLKNDFGRRFIVLPNPMYGDWETRGIYQHKYDWSDEERDHLRKSSIRAY